MLGVYISYPFCSQKCTYCNFASGVFSAAEQQRYNSALRSEVQRHHWSSPPDTIYWGGGTPSLMAPEDFVSVLSAIPTSQVREHTVECAPGTASADRIRLWTAAGVNRVSFGVQSFVPDEARRTGRKHTPDVVRAELGQLRQAGLSNMNLDLIAGLPGQTAASWKESLDWALRLEVPHISVYLFEADEDSALGRESLLGGVRYGAALLPAEEAMADFYETAVERFAREGLFRYEISNFARPGFESLHNLKYWRLDPYVGFGLDAHSFDGRFRWSNADTLPAYLQEIQNGPPSRARSETDPAEEHFIIGLRQSAGITPSAQEWTRFRAAIERGIAAGVLEHEGPRLRLTHKGVLVSNEILQEFVA